MLNREPEGEKSKHVAFVEPRSQNLPPLALKLNLETVTSKNDMEDQTSQ